MDPRTAAISSSWRKRLRSQECSLEESLSLKTWSCHSRLLPRTWDLQQLQLWEHPVALEAELALTLKVLETMAARHPLRAQSTQAMFVGSGLRVPHPSVPGSASHTTLLSPRQAPGPEVTSGTGCTDSRRPQRRSPSAAWKPLSCSTSSTSSPGTFTRTRVASVDPRI